ncbi:hypothetical protein ES703_119195 [subsurface metagenome]
MRNQTCIWLTVGICLLILTSPAPAQDEQRLQYHSEREAQQIVGDMGSSIQELTSEKPQGVELPQFKSMELPSLSHTCLANNYNRLSLWILENFFELFKLVFSADKYFSLGHFSVPRLLSCILE